MMYSYKCVLCDECDCDISVTVAVLSSECRDPGRVMPRQCCQHFEIRQEMAVYTLLVKTTLKQQGQFKKNLH